MADRYWVGNGGSWNDTSHWSTISGGGGGASVPTQNDNVYFDGSSFTLGNQSVNCINGTYYCADMDWSDVTNNPAFVIDGSSATLFYCYGSAIFNENMSLNNPYQDGRYAYFYFMGSGNHVFVTGNLHFWWRSIIFYLGNGTLTINGELNKLKEISFYSGTVNIINTSINPAMFNNGIITYLVYPIMYFQGGIGNFDFSNSTINVREMDFNYFPWDNPFIGTVNFSGSTINLYDIIIASGLDNENFNNINVYTFDYDAANSAAIWGSCTINRLEIIRYSSSMFRVALNAVLTCGEFIMKGEEGNLLDLYPQGGTHGGTTYKIHADSTDVSYVRINGCQNDILLDASDGCVDGGSNVGVWFGEQALIF